MLYLSFDIGIVNLGVCAIYNDKVIIWKVINLFEKLKKSIPISNLAETIYIHMDEIIGEIKDTTNNHTIDYILIENQPSKGMLKTTQTLIYGYFYNLLHYEGYVKDIVQVNPSMKLEGIDMDKTCSKQEQYKNNKAKSIEICLEMISGNERLNHIFNTYKKTDDLCDAMLQIAGFIKKRKKSHIKLSIE